MHIYINVPLLYQKFEIEVEGVHPVVWMMNQISEMFIPSNTIYNIILK
jgi:hypothetical protein